MAIGKRLVANGIDESDSITNFWIISEEKGCVRKGTYDFEELRTINGCDGGFFDQIT